MKFRNENTYESMVANGREEEFHTLYDKALDARLTSQKVSYPCYVGGKQIRMTEEFDAISPIDRSIKLGSFQRGDSELARTAARESAVAFASWSEVPWEDRVEVLRVAADRLRLLKFRMAATVTLSNGKNRYEAVAEVDEAIDMIMYYCSSMASDEGHRTPMASPYEDEVVESVMRPIGPWAVISPFNFPLAITTGMTAAALVTGNTVVLKPPSAAPTPAYELVNAMTAAGLPDGVLNVVTGLGRTLGSALVSDTAIKGVAFTGSRSVGKGILHVASEKRMPAVVEMGGKNGVVVTPNADVRSAVEGVACAAFGFSGQKCSATSRVYVHESIRESFTTSLVEMTRSLVVEDPVDRGTFMGPVISDAKAKEYLSTVELARSDGEVLCGGEELGCELTGRYMMPTVVTGLPDDHPISTDELFLPILVVHGYDDLDDAIARMNSSPYGLTAGIFSNDGGEVSRFFDRIESGVVYANRRRGATTGAIVGAQPFVGWKESGHTGIGAGGPHYLLSFMREQSRTRSER